MKNSKKCNGSQREETIELKKLMVGVDPATRMLKEYKESSIGARNLGAKRSNSRTSLRESGE